MDAWHSFVRLRATWLEGEESSRGESKGGPSPGRGVRVDSMVDLAIGGKSVCCGREDVVDRSMFLSLFLLVRPWIVLCCMTLS
jgi:hypothetical protein